MKKKQIKRDIVMRLLDEKNMSVRDLAENIGYSHQSVYNWLESPTRPIHAVLIANELDVNVELITD